jgi:hypothetical protein
MKISRLWPAPFLVALAGCVSTTRTIPRDWLSVPRTAVIRSVILSGEGVASPSSQPATLTLPRQGIHILDGGSGRRIANGDKPLTEEFAAIDSFDVSESRGEVVFSAKRTGGFDIGLVAVEGSDISWVPADPADELAVQWAPRGNKISYVIRSKYGDIVRTLHIPTSASFAVDYSFARVNAIGWDPQAERYAVAYSSPVSSAAVDALKYSGAQRTNAVPPAVKLDRDIQPFAGDAILIQPLDIRYNERLPVVIWQTTDPLSWNDARGELMKTARVALVVTGKAPDEVLLARIKGSPVCDPMHLYAVNASVEGATSITVDSSLPAGRFQENGNVVRVPPADIESFAARFIAHHLERNSPPHGSR